MFLVMAVWSVSRLVSQLIQGLAREDLLHHLQRVQAWILKDGLTVRINVYAENGVIFT
jgi:hypothetical protein